MARTPLFRVRTAPMVLLVAFGALALVVAAEPRSLVLMNEQVMAFVTTLRIPALTAFFRVVTFVADPVVLAILATSATLVLIGLRRPVDAVFVGGSTALTFGLSELFKMLVSYPRPISGFLTHLPSSQSFPSGHAICSLVFFGALALVIAQDRTDGESRTFVYVVAALAVLLVGVSRMYLGVHWITDVSGSWLLGAAILLTTADTWKRFRR